MAEEVLIDTNGKSTRHLTLSLLAVALLSSFGSSLLYGYNLAVVNSPAEFIKDFYNQTIVRRYGSGVDEENLTLLYSVTVSIFAIGGLVGSLTVGMQVTRFGSLFKWRKVVIVLFGIIVCTTLNMDQRKQRIEMKGTLVRSTALVFVGGAMMGFSRLCESPEMIIIGRFITGIHSGISLSVVPMYLGEIAPKNLRGFLGLVPSIFICLGVFFAQILGLHEFLGKEDHWPLFLSLVVVPTFIQLMLLPWFPESPRYLMIEKRNIHATIKALKCYRAKCDIQDEMEEMEEEQRTMTSVETVSVLQLFKDLSVRWQLITIIVVNAGMQLSGIDAIWFYTNAIFENAGISAHQIQYITVGTGAIEVIAGLIGCFTIERVGRRLLMISGFSFMGICCAGITVSLLLQTHVTFMRYISVACVVGIIAGFCIGPAGVPFLMTGELFKQSHRSSAYIVGGSLNWMSNFAVGFVFPFLQMSAGAFCYLVFCVMCVGVAVYVYFIIPETKNKTFVEISQMFALRNGCEIDNQALTFADHLTLKKMNGYGTVVPQDMEK